MFEKGIVEKAKDLHNSIAQDVFPNGAILRCSECGVEKDVSTEECGYYLGHGWPICCELAMTMEVKKEQPKKAQNESR